MNIKRLSILILALSTGTSFAAPKEKEFHWTSGSELGDSYTFQFQFTPDARDVWDRTKQDTPPLSPGKAASLALNWRTNIPMPKPFGGWHVVLIELRIEDSNKLRISRSLEEAWIYIVTLQGYLGPGSWNGPLPWKGGPEPRFTVPVRLNGTIPEAPVVRQRT